MKRCLNCMQEYGDQFEICPHCGFIEGTPPKEIYHLNPGTILRDRFIVGTVVGFGGFGVVYRAWDTALDKMVAIKEFYPVGLIHRTPGEEKVNVFASKRDEFELQKARFLEEARNMAKFSSHPNIINVYNLFEENNTAYIDMEFLDGITYKKFLKQQGGVVSQEVAVMVIVAVLEALQEIHKDNIIHRDVAPDNIFICEDGRIKLMDFGAARFSKGDEVSSHTIILKPGFAPPEQYQSKSRQGVFTDIYAVGAVLYRSLTGIMPDESTNRCEEDNLKPPKELNPEISDTMNNVIMRAMALMSELRFQTDEEFINALKPSSEGKIRDVKSELRHRKKKRFVGIVFAILFLAICGFVGYRMYDLRRAQIDLKAADITMWVCVPDESWSDNYKNAYLNALSEYISKYPQIGIEIIPIVESDYAQRLSEAYESKNMPDVFQINEESQIEYAKEIDRTYSYIDTSQYVGFDVLKDVYSDLNVCPITFELPVLYTNTTYERLSDEEYTQIYEEITNGGLNHFEYEQTNSFINGENGYLFADTSLYRNVQEKLAGIYTMEILDLPQHYTEYGTIFCVSKDTNRWEYNAAVQLMYYLLSENAQFVMIENHLGLPVHREIYDQFVNLNPEFEVFNEVINEIKFIQ